MGKFLEFAILLFFLTGIVAGRAVVIVLHLPIVNLRRSNEST
jgi:hypothetical protein